MRRLLPLALLALAVGCGGVESENVAAPAPEPRTSEPTGTRCEPSGPDFRVCTRYPRSHTDTSGAYNGTIETRAAGGWRKLDVRAPFRQPSPGLAVVGHWERVFPSPDGRTLLAQWIAECEIPVAFFVDADGGRPRPVGRDRHGPAASTAVGWTNDGRAIVDFPNGACGGNERPGVYLVSLEGERKLWKATGSVEPSLRVRSAG